MLTRVVFRLSIDEAIVLQSLTSSAKIKSSVSSGRGVYNYTSESLKPLRGKERFDVIDIRERVDVGSAISGVLPIPFQELPYRASYELDKTKLHLVDCGGIKSDLCDNGALALLRAGFRAGTINKGAYRASCQTTKSFTPRNQQYKPIVRPGDQVIFGIPHYSEVE